MAAECYALGLDPADATNDFRIVSIEMVDVKPKIEWEPKVNRWTGAERRARRRWMASGRRLKGRRRWRMRRCGSSRWWCSRGGRSRRSATLPPPRWRLSMRAGRVRGGGMFQNMVPSRMNSGRFACMMPLRCWMGSLRVRTYFG